MKIQIKDLEPNPYRDIKNYPLNKNRVESLKRSISQTGYWDNILARKKDGIIQIAYGQHRIEALRELYGNEKIIEVIIKDISDDNMLRIMLLENDEDFDAPPGLFTGDLKKVWDKLKQRFPLKEVVIPRSKYSTLFFDGLPFPPSGLPCRTKLTWQIANWIAPNYSEKKIYTGLELLKSTGQIEIDDKGTKQADVDREAMEMMPNKTTAEKFVKAIQKLEIPKEKQLNAAKKICERERFDKTTIENILLEEKLGLKEKTEKKTKEFEQFIQECRKEADKLNRKLQTLIEYKDDFDSDYYRKTFDRLDLASSAFQLIEKINILFGGKSGKQNDKYLPALSNSK